MHRQRRPLIVGPEARSVLLPARPLLVLLHLQTDHRRVRPGSKGYGVGHTVLLRLPCHADPPRSRASDNGRSHGTGRRRMRCPMRWSQPRAQTRASSGRDERAVATQGVSSRVSRAVIARSNSAARSSPGARAAGCTRSPRLLRPGRQIRDPAGPFGVLAPSATTQKLSRGHPTGARGHPQIWLRCMVCSHWEGCPRGVLRAPHAQMWPSCTYRLSTSRGTRSYQRRRLIGVGWLELALLPEPRPKARNLPTRYGARDVGAQANRIRLAGPAFVVSSTR